MHNATLRVAAVHVWIIAGLLGGLPAAVPAGEREGGASGDTGPIKVFVLAGDENCLEQGVVEGRTDGSDAEYFPGATPAKDEQAKHVNCAVYKGAYAAGTDYDSLTPAATGVSGIPCTGTPAPSSTKEETPHRSKTTKGICAPLLRGSSRRARR